MVRSCELSWLISWVVFIRRMKMLNELAFFSIPTMSTVVPDVSGGVSLGGWGNVGTKGVVGAVVGGVD